MLIIPNALLDHKYVDSYSNHRHFGIKARWHAIVDVMTDSSWRQQWQAISDGPWREGNQVILTFTIFKQALTSNSF